MAEPAGEIFVLAGTNGAGKSSIAGARIRAAGLEYFNPDEATRRLLAANAGMSADEANGLAWNEGRRRLEQAIRQRTNYAFETTLGGNTIPALLARAAAEGIGVRMWYCGLATPDLHLARVRARAARGGHDIPETKVRQRYDDSRQRLIDLVPVLTELYVYDNSAEADPATGVPPQPVLLLHLLQGSIQAAADPASMPAWAKPIVMAAMKAQRSR